ncbi:MAG TPA: pyridoxamine 5'-phosphate oxidase family protein [Polyangia bacterium]|nr:pyridoxamine 5'-phosphate oxidase family protein [Polyangia bacterium]
MSDQPEQKTHAHLLELLKSFDTAMLVTRTGDGAMRARPLSLSEEHDQQRLYFATSVDSPKVGEIADDPTVLITLQDSKRYVSIGGTATITRDRGLIDRLWREAWKVWFPAGKDDPALCLVVVRPTAAEYWDQSGLKGIKYLFDMAKAYATGTTPDAGASSDNQKISFR